jgi:hypothetical protein
MLKLTSQAGRVAFILGVIDSMRGPVHPSAPIKVADLRDILADEVQKRPRTKPCVAENMVFPSTIEAARYLAHHRRDLWENSKAAQRQDAHAVMENLRNRVKNWCNSDDRFGYYWI